MVSNPRPKRQHYVPRFYLEHFIDTDGMVWSYDIQRNEVRPATPENTAVETNFYSIVTNEGDYNDEIEHWLQTVESNASGLLPKVVDGERLKGQEKADFAVFISSLYARSPAIVTAYAEAAGYMAQHVTDLVLSDRSRFEAMKDRLEKDKEKVTTPEEREAAFEYARDKSRYTVHVDKKRGLPALGVADHLAEIIYDMTWIVLESREQHIIVSDNPVVQVNPPTDDRSVYGGGGFLDKRTSVSLPLSPSKLLLLTWNRDASEKVHRVDKKMGRLFNRQQAYFAERYLYASRRDAGIQALGRKYASPGFRVHVSEMERLAPVEVKRKLAT